MKQVEGALKDMGMDWAGGKISEIFGSSVSSVFSTFFKKVVPIIGWIYAIYQGVQLVINLLTKCDNDDTSKDPNGKNDYELQNDIHLYRCDFVSKYCSMKNPLHIGGCGLGGCVGDCVEFTEVYCCFDSPLSRILNKQVRYAQKSVQICGHGHNHHVHLVSVKNMLSVGASLCQKLKRLTGKRLILLNG